VIWKAERKSDRAAGKMRVGRGCCWVWVLTGFENARLGGEGVAWGEGGDDVDCAVGEDRVGLAMSCG
jgi:hypothetical protein